MNLTATSYVLLTNTFRFKPFLLMGVYGRDYATSGIGRIGYDGPGR
jgi:hypothetical protein